MLSDRLKAKKEESGLTIQQIAEKCDRPASTVSRILSGQTEDPSFRAVSDIAHVIGCPLDELSEHATADTAADPDVIALYEKIIASKNRWLVRLVVICCVLVGVLAFLLVYDATHPYMGTIRY